MRKPDVGVVAVAGGDVHACHKPPLARSGEPDWYGAMARPLREIRNLCRQHQCPFLCSGDIFDDGWRQHRCPPELINFLLAELPAETYAVPGNHDLPNHNYQELKRSAFWTLVQSGKVKMLEASTPRPVITESAKKIVLHGFPYGAQLKAAPALEPLSDEVFGWMRIAVVHHFCWKEGHVHPGAKEEDHVRTLRKKLNGYKVAVFGDNHSGFLSQLKNAAGVTIFNGGTLMRRRVDEVDYSPRVGLIYSDGTVKQHYLDTSQDILETDPKLDTVLENLPDLSAVLEGLKGMADTGLNFVDAVTKYVEDHPELKQSVRELVFKCLEGKL